MKELISVIVPIYNIEDYVRRCVESILGQTYTNLEILLIDDGSTDNSKKICEEYAREDSRVKFYTKENGGLSDARNYGITRSTGKYITTIDGDDFVGETYIENLYNLLIANNADISSINRFNFYENSSNGIVEKFEYYNNAKQTTIYNSEEYLKQILRDKLPHEAWAKLFKKEILEQNKYQVNLKVFEDLEHLLRVLENLDLKIVCNTNIFDYYYRQRETSIMNESFNEYWEKELDYYVVLFNNPQYKNYKKEIENLIIGKLWRNFKKVVKEEESKNRIKHINETAKLLKVKHITGKKDKIRLVLFKYTPNLFLKIAKVKNLKAKIFYKKFKKYIDECRKNHEEENIIFNGPTTGNIGDHAILFAEEKYLKEQGKKVFLVSAKEMPYFYKYKCYGLVSENANIYITGGGNTGSLWRNEQSRINKVLDTFKTHKITIFPQTIYYINDEKGREHFEIDYKYFTGCSNIEFQCRDARTYQFITENFKIPAVMTKDIALTLDYRNLNCERTGILFCFRKDLEKNISDKDKQDLIDTVKRILNKEKYEFIDTVLTEKTEYEYKSAKKEFDKIIKKFASSKLVVTDRLHGMIIAHITGTPCIALNNLSGKVKGVYDTIKDDENNIIFIENHEIGEEVWIKLKSLLNV